jgi:hypothetical protein
MGHIQSTSFTGKVLPRVQRVAFINIDSRTDRMANIKESLTKLQVPPNQIHRISATVKEPAYKACSESHIRALQLLAAVCSDGWVGVFEDDIQVISNTSQIAKTIEEAFASLPTMRVLMLAVNPFKVKKSKVNGVKHVKWALTSAAYIVHVLYIPTLIQSLRDSIEKDTPLDVHWKHIQQDGTWYCLSPPLGTQMAGFSDIEKRHVDYGM